MPANTELYVLRHATPKEDSDADNIDRPLSKLGRRQADSLVDYLSSLNFDAIYTSPYLRARETIEPLCESTGLVAKVRKGLSESAEDEELQAVGKRVTRVVNAIVKEHPEGRVLVCTHGGCMWGLIATFDNTFGHKEYKKIKCPDMRQIVYENGTPRLIEQLTF